jgi:cellulose synthase (UDP-forming)
MSQHLETPGFLTHTFRFAIACVTGFLLFLLVSLYLPWQEQLVLGIATVVVGLIVNKCSRSRVITIALMMISSTATLRYFWWRAHMLADYFTDDSNNRGVINSTLILMLLAAEAYTVVIMFLGYMQTAWPLKRKPIPLPADESLWPHVDLLIPTYNEPLSLVRYTALAALAIDYPPEKLHVYILDDGTREDFRLFAEEASVGYITRVNHDHAKAGNINHALTEMNSEFVAIFDCDHVPTRSFLQITLGWMIADQKLAMMQTPHHFYSPDPFERNLLQYKTIPNEGELFYGIVQDGNDFWNATFFCGSCALLRRSALDEAGGIATETVTEDAHTSLRLQKLGYNTAYINIPQAAGLATETLAAHVGQRIRWARGMIQILRTDNPLFGGKMKLSQRLCYFNAMAHFLYAVPRLVFLLAPLVYLLLGRIIIPGYWAAIVVYALPHLILSNLTNSRVQGSHRHSFWNEIYETVLAPFILAPTVLALINPRLGKFNVTGKGNTLAQTRFDRSITRPTKLMLALNACGMGMALYLLFIKGTIHTGAVVMNLVWVIFNMVILGVAAAVAYEQKQRRTSVRVEARLPVSVRMRDGRRFAGMTTDMSVGGASIQFPHGVQFVSGELFNISFPEQTGAAEIDVRAVDRKDDETRVAFVTPTIADQEIVARALYSRADAWLQNIDKLEVDRPLVSLARVVHLSFFGIYQILRSLFAGRDGKPEPVKASTEAAALLVLLLLAEGTRLCGQVPGTVPNSAPHAAVQHFSPASQPASDHDGIAAAESSVTADNLETSRQSITFKDMGLTAPMELRGPHSWYSLRFTLAYTAIPRKASLRLIYSLDPGLDLHATSIGVLLNGIPVATVLPAPQSGQSSPGQQNRSFTTDLSLPDSLLVRANNLTLEFKETRESKEAGDFNGTGPTGQPGLSGQTARGEQANTRVLARVSPSSSLEVDGDRIAWQSNLSQLPLPIFDPDLDTTTTIPFVFLSRPTPNTLQAAGVVASWLGLLVSTRPVRFVVSEGTIPAGNAIVFASDKSLLPASLQFQGLAGPVLSLRPNPGDDKGSVLVLAGDSENQLLRVAQALSLTRNSNGQPQGALISVTGDTATIVDGALPPLRAADDSPRWLTLTKGARFAGCSGQDTLQSDGSSPIPVYFHLPPGAQFGDKENLSLRIHYRYDARQIAAGSALRVVLNGVMVADIPLIPGASEANGQRIVQVPVEVFQPFGNTMLFHYDFVPANRSAAGQQTAVLNGKILCDSTLDLHGLTLWTAMPNLELFSNAGFPFTQYADLQKTTVVLPDAPHTKEIALYLYLMAHFGAQTGYPGLRVTVAGPNATIGPGRDYLVVGTIGNQPAFAPLDSIMPVALSASGIQVRPAAGFRAAIGRAQTLVRTLVLDKWNTLAGKPPINNLSTVAGVPDVLVEEARSTASPDRSIVMVALRQDSSVDPFASAFLDRSQTRDMTGPVSLLIGSKLESYPVGAARYNIGEASPYVRLRIWFGESYLLLLCAVTPLTLLVALWTYGWMARRAHERLKLGEQSGE